MLNDLSPLLDTDYPLPDAQKDFKEDQVRRLGGIQGLNFENGLRVIRGNIPKYLVLLSLFAESYQKHTEQILELLAAEMTTSLETIAYSLRGSAGLVGAQSVSEAANSVLSALRYGRIDEVKQHGIILVETLSCAVNSIQSALAHPDEVTALLGDIYG